MNAFPFSNNSFPLNFILVMYTSPKVEYCNNATLEKNVSETLIVSKHLTFDE